MTERLYYNDSFLQIFEARVLEVRETPMGTAVLLDRSAFYPTSGGQNFDTGWISLQSADSVGRKTRIINVEADESSGEVLHYLDAPADLASEATIQGTIDAGRRRDHMQQHTGQHVLSAAFEKLYQFPTVSFHMGDESCTIDLATEAMKPAHMEAAERLANEIIFEDRPVEIRFATPDEARNLGVRKIPAAEREKLRLIDIRDFDLNACGGTHVRSTGQIGSILLRKIEKVRQGVRVEFVCGLRAVATARRDYTTLTNAAAAFSTHIYELPQQSRKALDDVKSAQKAQAKLLEEVAELQAAQCVQCALTPASGAKLVVQFLPERDLVFIKMLAQKITRTDRAIALLACGGVQPSLVFAQTPGLTNDMGALMKETVQKLGTRGGGNRDMAQGGAPDTASAEKVLAEVKTAIQ